MEHTNNMKKIVMVCSGNNDRSPTAEHIGNLELKRLGADGEFIATSAGVQVNRILSGDYSVKEIRDAIEVGYKMGLI